MKTQYVSDIIHDITDHLAQEYRSDRIARANAWALLQKITGKSHSELLVAETIELTSKDTATLQQWIADITQHHKPIQYVLETVPFLDVEMYVEPPVVIPRPETETWCHRLITQLQEHNITQFRLLDLCTGTGCVAIAIAHAFPDATVYAADISSHALELAHKNAVHNNVDIRYIQSNVFQQIPFEVECDIIVANPPYITQDEWKEVRERVTQWEDPQALVAPDDGLGVIQDIVTQAPHYIKPWTYDVPQLWIEIGYLQGAAVSRLFENAGFTHVAIGKDLSHHDRVVTGHMPHTSKKP